MINSNLIIKYVFLMLFLNIYNNFAQDKTFSNLSNWYDTAVGKENTSINNGKLQNILYRSLPTKHPYLLDSKFIKGTVTITDNTFYNLDLRYDISTDDLVMKPFGEQENRSVIITPENVNSFEINNKKFINLGKLKANNSDIVSGYYEQNLKANNLVFYIKYHKDRKELLMNEAVKSDFYEADEYLVFINNTFNSIRSKGDLIKLFPDYKSKINDFYNLNTTELKEDKTIFMANVMKYIPNLIPNKQN